MFKKNACLIAGLVFAFPCFVCADFVSFGFVRQTTNATTNIAPQMLFQIWDDTEAGVPSGNVLFKFINDMNGTGTDGTFSQIYWDDVNGLLSTTTDPVFSANVNHTLDHVSGAATMAFTLDMDLMGGDKPPGIGSWDASDTDFNFDADNATQTGVERLEMGGFLFTLTGANTFTDVINSIEAGTLRIAIHAQGILPDSENQSDSFLNGTTPIPEPSTPLLFAIIIGAVSCRRRR